MQMRKHVATLTALALVLAFLVVFFVGRYESKPLHVVAPRVGLTADQLLAMVPRIASQSGATLGTSRRVVYLMACSGVPNSANLEAQALIAADIAEKQRVTPREAAKSVLAEMRATNGAATLKDC
jgi:hypothetical protein